MTAGPLGPGAPAQPPRLLDQFRAAARAAGQPVIWVEPLTSWIIAFINFHGKRHPRELDAAATPFCGMSCRRAKTPWACWRPRGWRCNFCMRKFCIRSSASCHNRVRRSYSINCGRCCAWATTRQKRRSAMSNWPNASSCITTSGTRTTCAHPKSNSP